MRLILLHFIASIYYSTAILPLLRIKPPYVNPRRWNMLKDVDQSSTLTQSKVQSHFMNDTEVPYSLALGLAVAI